MNIIKRLKGEATYSVRYANGMTLSFPAHQVPPKIVGPGWPTVTTTPIPAWRQLLSRLVNR